MLAFIFLAASSLAACVFGEFVAEVYIDEISERSARARDINNQGRSHYEPVIYYASESQIRVKYLDKDEYAQPEEAMKIISKHCKGSFTETSREKSLSVTYIEAECT
jgi:hypothetical protein